MRGPTGRNTRRRLPEERVARAFWRRSELRGAGRGGGGSGGRREDAEGRKSTAR